MPILCQLKNCQYQAAILFMTFYIVLFKPVCIAAHDKLLRATHFAHIALPEIGSELRFFRRSLRSLPPHLRCGPPAIKRGCLGLQNLNLRTVGNDRHWLRHTAIRRLPSTKHFRNFHLTYKLSFQLGYHISFALWLTYKYSSSGTITVKGILHFLYIFLRKG